MVDSFSFYPFIIVWSKIEVFRLVQGKLLLVDLLSQYELLPFSAMCNLIAKMHNTSKFWMQISFIILFIIDLYKDNHVCVCMCW